MSRLFCSRKSKTKKCSIINVHHLIFRVEILFALFWGSFIRIYQNISSPCTFSLSFPAQPKRTTKIFVQTPARNESSCVVGDCMYLFLFFACEFSLTIKLCCKDREKKKEIFNCPWCCVVLCCVFFFFFSFSSFAGEDKERIRFLVLLQWLTPNTTIT